MVIPDEYLSLSDKQLQYRIKSAKQKYGKKLIILGHHYQRDEVIEFADYRGDSFDLSKKAAEHKDAEYIVFCGVHFMAEAADILSASDQTIHLPSLDAGCPLAAFADLESVMNAWQEIDSISDSKTITPITYINSSADLKAFCGKHGGAVCTSSNASKILQWSFQQNEKVFFFPDQHLGRNTANKMGISAEKIILWDRSKPLGGNSADKIKKSKIILWNGHCHVHTFFNIRHIQKFKKKFPQGKVIVHPECSEDIVDVSSYSGSTSAIIKYVENAKPGSIIAIGTELNLVNRLKNNNPDKQIFPLAISMCPNMYKINLHNLCWTLENLGKINMVCVEENIIKPARIALEQMLEIG